MTNQTNDKPAAIIIYLDGSMTQVAPVSIAFYEQVAKGVAEYATRLKQQAMIAPQPQPEAEDDQG